MRATTRVRPLTLLLLLLSAAVPASAGGPLAVCGSGQAFLWPGGGVGIPFNPDQGNLGPLTNAQAVLLTQEAFDVWGAVPTSTATYVNAGPLPEDVDVTNFIPYLFPVAPDGLSAIVFDDTGEIFDLLFGPGSGILGFAGPEWVDFSNCEILEGLAFLNGPSFDDPTAAKDVMVHEFGHYSNLAHTVVNGQNLDFGDGTGPTPFNTFGDAPLTTIETMYPFYFGPGSGTETLHQDDAAMLSTLYPEADFLSDSGQITGTILAPNGTSPLTGVNVIARNVDDPFEDAASSLSSDFSFDFSPGDPLTGVYTLRGLTPGARYVVYVDQVLAGGFSTPPSALPGPEEFWNGANESNNITSPDDPGESTVLEPAAGVPVADVDVILQTFQPGDVLPVGDDGFVPLFLPFPFEVCGQEFDSVFVNANGSLTFGAGSDSFAESVVGMLGGPPRIAGLWDDLNAGAGGAVTFDQTDHTFTVFWKDVPEFPSAGANTFSITLHRHGNKASIDYGHLDARDGLAGLSCGGAVTSGFEEEQQLRRFVDRRTIDLTGRTAAFEQFIASDNDLAGFRLRFVGFENGFDDVYEPNDTLATARPIHLPYDNADLHRFSAIAPVGGDVDYYRFRAKANEILAIETVRGAFDTLIGLYDGDTGNLLAVDDDSGNGLLSRLLLQIGPDDLNVVLAVTAFDDFDFDGDGFSGGRYVLSVRSYRGTLLAAGDDTSTAVPIPFYFPFQGSRRTSVFVNSNGNLTFGGGDVNPIESVAGFLGGQPRIAPLWDDLDADFGLVIEERTPWSLSLHYVSVPEFGSASPNYFTVDLFFGGFVALRYGPTARSDGLVGITRGGGAADPGETDLSESFLLDASGTTYELFGPGEPLDMSFRTRFALP